MIEIVCESLGIRAVLAVLVLVLDGLETLCCVNALVVLDTDKTEY